MVRMYELVTNGYVRGHLLFWVVAGYSLEDKGDNFQDREIINELILVILINKVGVLICLGGVFNGS